MDLTKKRRYTDKYFALPALIWVGITTQIPFIITIVFSLLKWNMVRPDLGQTFNWFNNYAYFLWGSRAPEFWSIVWQTVQITGGALLASTVFGFMVAILLDNDLPLINVVRTLVLGPFFVMSTTSGVIWKVTILNMTFGWYAVICNALGLPILDFLSNYPVPLVTFLFVWQWMPFFVLIILGGLQSISTEVLESARLDGCRWFAMTFRIKLPMIINYMQVAIMLGMIFIFKEFGLILVTTAGGPGKRSYNLAYYIYDQMFVAKRVGRAATVSVLMVLMVLVVVNLLNRAIKRRSEMLD